jgi:hypothetical protein
VQERRGELVPLLPGHLEAWLALAVLTLAVTALVAAAP